jgi:glycosyltransferase involved in cell wall biosynthesis
LIKTDNRWFRKIAFSNMRVSVIVPNYNHAEYLKQRIDSILNQTYRDFELIILDDGSTDNSREIIDDYVSRFPFIISRFNEVNSGSPFIQWDSGVNKAEGELIWIAESDDFAETTFLEKTTSVMKTWVLFTVILM